MLKNRFAAIVAKWLLRVEAFMVVSLTVEKGVSQDGVSSGFIEASLVSCFAASCRLYCNTLLGSL